MLTYIWCQVIFTPLCPWRGLWCQPPNWSPLHQAASSFQPRRRPWTPKAGTEEVCVCFQARFCRLSSAVGSGSAQENGLQGYTAPGPAKLEAEGCHLSSKHRSAPVGCVPCVMKLRLTHISSTVRLFNVQKDFSHQERSPYRFL